MLEIMDSDGSEDEEIALIPSISSGAMPASAAAEADPRSLAGHSSPFHRRAGSETTHSSRKFNDPESNEPFFRRQSSLPPSSPGYDADKLSFSKAANTAELSERKTEVGTRKTGYNALPPAALFSDGNEDLGFRESALNARHYYSDVLVEGDGREYLNEDHNDRQMVPTQSISETVSQECRIPGATDAVAVLGQAYIAPGELMLEFNEGDIHTGLTNSDDLSDHFRECIKSPPLANLGDDLRDELAQAPGPAGEPRIPDAELLPTQTMSDPDLKPTQLTASLQESSFVKPDVSKENRKRKRGDNQDSSTPVSITDANTKKGKKKKKRKADPKSEERALTPDAFLDLPQGKTTQSDFVLLISPLNKKTSDKTQDIVENQPDESLAKLHEEREEPEETEEAERKPLAETPPNASPQKPKKPLHSPLNSSKVPFRVGLSKRRSVPSLLTIRK